MTVAPFVYETWAARYPELRSAADKDLAAMYFAEAGLYCANTDGATVPADPTTFQPRQMILYMITAHICALNAPLNGQPSSPIVGRISSATEGSVSVSASMDGLPGSAAWWATSKYGIAAWAAMAPFRTATYRPAPRNCAAQSFRAW